MRSVIAFGTPRLPVVTTPRPGLDLFRVTKGLPMSRRRQIYEGKAKILYEGPEPGTLIQYFKDDATAFNAQKKGTISGKGVLNNRISEPYRRAHPLHSSSQHARATHSSS